MEKVINMSQKCVRKFSQNRFLLGLYRKLEFGLSIKMYNVYRGGWGYIVTNSISFPFPCNITFFVFGIRT